MISSDDIAAAGQLACLLEVSAPKPGNVSPNLHFHDTRYEDFLASAVAIRPALAAAGSRPLGATIRSAVEATARWTRSNTNLGIVLLLAPLARAAARGGGGTSEPGWPACSTRRPWPMRTMCTRRSGLPGREDSVRRRRRTWRLHPA